MLKRTAMLVAAISFVTSAAGANVHQKKRHVAQGAITGAALGGALGLAGGGPGAAAGAAVGATIGAAVANTNHPKKYAGYKYWDGWYYDGKGHRFTAVEMQQRIPDPDASKAGLGGYKGFYGWYYDGRGHRFSYWKGSYFDERGHRYTAAQISQRP
jgi:hypothetical protein